MIDFVEPPKLWIPERPAIIRPGIDLARYFPVDLDRHARRAIVSELIKSGRVEKGAIPFGMFTPAPVSSALNLTFRDNRIDLGNATTYTFSSVPVGTANANRHVFVAVTGAGTAGRVVTGVTIGGVSATIGVQEAHSSSEAAVVSIWGAKVTTGTSISVVVTWTTGGQLRTGIGVWTADGILSLTPVHTITSQSDPATGTLTAVSGRLAIVAFYQRSDPGSVTWGSPLNPPDYEDLPAAYEARYQGGKAVVASGSSISVSVDPSTNDRHVMVAASYN